MSQIQEIQELLSLLCNDDIFNSLSQNYGSFNLILLSSPLLA